MTIFFQLLRAILEIIIKHTEIDELYISNFNTGYSDLPNKIFMFHLRKLFR